MKPRAGKQSRRRLVAGLTIIEVLVASGLGSLVLGGIASLIMYSARSAAAVVNYTDLDTKSRYALDVIGRELRQATAVLAFQTNLPVKSLTLTNANQASCVRLTYDSAARTLVFSKTGQPDLTALAECDQFGFALYQRTPCLTATNILYYPATNIAGLFDASLCKLISLSWKCSRTIYTERVNTESVQAAQIVLRNKQ